MTSFVVSRSTADGLLQGRYAIDRFDATCASCGGVLVVDGQTWVHRDPGCCVFPDPTRRHLVPVGPHPPVCAGCGGAGWVVVDQTMGWPYGEQIQCADCDGLGHPKELTLTVECPSCEGAGEDCNGWANCLWCKGGQQSVAVVHVEKVLQIMPWWEDDYPQDVLLISDDGTKLEWRKENARWVQADVSHLLSFGEWSGYALLITGIETK